MSKELTQQLIGKVLTEDVGRDAIHIAVVPMIARGSGKLYPGQDIGLDGISSANTPHVGIVDPFLKSPVLPGEMFFMFLYPNTITSLRHEWTHPAFEASPAPATMPHVSHQEKSRYWLKTFATETIDIGYEGLMRAAQEWVEHEEHTVQHGSENWRDDFYGHEKDFWHHYEIVTGTKVKNPEAHFFCCMC